MPLSHKLNSTTHHPRDDIFTPPTTDATASYASNNTQTDYETSESDTVITPSDYTPTAVLDGTTELNRNLVRDEVDRALATVMGTLADLLAKRGSGV